jgi:hypothetical protein
VHIHCLEPGSFDRRLLGPGAFFSIAHVFFRCLFLHSFLSDDGSEVLGQSEEFRIVQHEEGLLGIMREYSLNRIGEGFELVL